MSRNPLDIAFGYAAGYRSFQAHGYSAVISTDGDRVVGSGMDVAATTAGAGPDHVHMLDTSGTLSITRADGADTGRVIVNYLTDDWRERVALFDLAAGATASTDIQGQTITARRVLLMDYEDGGNAGTIDAKIDGSLVDRIAAADGLSRTAHMTTPFGQRVCLTGFGLAAQSTRPVEISLWFKVPGRKPKRLNRWPARESLEVFQLPNPRLIQAVDLTDASSPVPIKCGIDLFVTAKRPFGSMGTSDVSAYLGFIAQVTNEDPTAPGFQVY